MKLKLLVAAATMIFSANTLAVPVTVADLGDLNGDANFAGILAANEVQWISFSANNFSYLDIASGSSGGIDTEIGVYDSVGNLVANDDDDGVGLLSVLSFGAGSGMSLGDLFNLGGDGIANGEDGALPSGTYYLAIGEFNVIFNATNFDAVSIGIDTGGPYTIDIFTDATAAQVPEPGTLALFGLGVLGLALARRPKQ